MDVVGALLSAVLQVVCDRLATPEFWNLFRERKHDFRLLKKLQTNLLAVQMVLDDAEKKQAHFPAARKWLEELQDAVFRAEDLVDEINTEALRVTVESEFQSKTKQVSVYTYTSCLSNEFLQEVMPKIELIVDTLTEFVQQVEVLEHFTQSEPKNHPCRLPSSSLVDYNAVYGRDADKEQIIQMLLSDVVNRDYYFAVIPLVGLGGLGKTTLAQLVYNDDRVKTHFDTKAWVYVSDEYDAIRIMKALLEELHVSCYNSGDNYNSLQVQLEQVLTKKKFLLVLDDVWNISYSVWERLISPFKAGREGSKIIVTTRSESTALMMCNGPIYHLHFLSEEDCWSLFRKHAFGNRDPRNPELEMIGKDIVKKCGGLPLAIKSLAGLLRSKLTMDEWNDISRSNIWDLPQDQNDILPALRISFNHLPYHLKRRFAYCTVFHKGYKFRKEEVIFLWIANDLLENPQNNRRIEDIGYEYLRELRSRLFFQQSSDGRFFMHDLVNDLAKSITKKYFLRLEDHHLGHGMPARVRFFSYIIDNYDAFERFKFLSEAKNLRAFLPMSTNGNEFNTISKKLLHDLLSTFRSLRVLSLSGYSSITELPHSFSNLMQLRSLDLSFTKIILLTDWICTLYNLMTLLLIHCRSLKVLPADMRKLINLRHLDITGVPLKKMPMQMGRLKNLHLLSAFVASKNSGSRIEELGKLPDLGGKLAISGLENVVSGRDALMANIKGKKHIKELILNWNGSPNDLQAVEDVFENLQPHSNIEHVRIDGYYGTRFPNWLGNRSFGQIASLSLCNCECCFCLPPIGQLVSLESLTICGMSKVSKVGKEIYGDCSENKPFQSLKVFRIERMQEWKEWFIPENEVLSSLEELYIIDCPKLIGELPKQLLSIRIFEISGCPQLASGSISMNLFQQLSSLEKLRISKVSNLDELSSEFNKLTSLEEFKIADFPSMVCFPLDCLPGKLKRLEVMRCRNLEFQAIEMIETYHESIQELSITSACDSLKNLSLGMFPQLQNLTISNCRNVEVLSVPPRNQNLTSLQSLQIAFCDNLMSFPDGGLHAPNLSQISLNSCAKLKSLPERMYAQLPSLQTLYIRACPEIECFPEGGLPSGLETLTISDCVKLVSRRSEWSLQRLPSLTEFNFHLTEQEESLPENWLLPCSLRVLRLWYHENLKMLDYEGLQHLTSLETLRISNCPKLESLPEEGLPASISRLQIIECPLLKPRLDSEKGEDWRKVAHIRCVIVDDEIIP